MSEWRLAKLGSVTSKIGSGATPRGGESVYTAEGVALIRSQNVLDNSMIVDGIARIDDPAAEALRGATVHPNDILINITGDSVARCAMVDPSVLPARVNQHVAIVRTTADVDPRFIQKLLVGPEFKSRLLTIATGGGTRNALTKAQLSNLLIPIPPRQTQQAIAEVLGALDDKIAANTALAASIWDLLEAKFRSVQSHAEPAGLRLADVATLEYGKALPSSSRIPGDVVVVGSGGASGTHSQALVGQSGVVIGRKGTAGSVHWINGPHFPIDTTFFVRATRDEYSQPYLYFLLRGLRLAEMNNDSAVPGLNRSEALALPVRVPTDHRVGMFSNIAASAITLADAVERESRTLAVTRDTLLPQLMSGKLRVRDAEAAASAAGA